MGKNKYYRNDGILIQDETYILKKQSENDKQDYFNLYKETSIFSNRMESTMFLDFFENLWKEKSGEDAIFVSVFRKQGRVYLGNIVLRNLESATPELGIDIVKKYQRKGVAYHALRMFMKHVRTVSNLDYFLVRIYSDNVASLRLFQKLGAIEIGQEPSEYQAFLNQMKTQMGQEEYENLKIKNPHMEDVAGKRYIIHYKVLCEEI